MNNNLKNQLTSHSKCIIVYLSTTPRWGIGYRFMKRRKYMQAEKTKVVRLLKTARGQMDGILKMVEEDRYCIDISTQLMATEAILNKVNKEILTAHLKHCLAHTSSREEQEQKIDELVSMLGKLMK